MGRIVVGVDGSEPSKAALTWAVAEAGLRSASLDAIFAFRLPAGWLGLGESMGATATTGITEEDVEAYARSTLDAVVAELEPDPSGAVVEMTGRTVPGHAAQVLVKASDGAELLVVGSSGRGDFGSVLLGSVGLHCVHHAGCPVVVVRGPRQGD